MNSPWLPPGYSSEDELPMRSRWCYGILSCTIVIIFVALLSGGFGLIFLGGNILVEPNYTSSELTDAILYILSGVVLGICTMIAYMYVMYHGWVKYLCWINPKYNRVTTREDVEILIPADSLAVE